MTKVVRRLHAAINCFAEQRCLWHFLIVFAATHLTGCAYQLWTQVKVSSDPSPSVVTIRETGRTIATAPGIYEFSEWFWPFESIERQYTFVFRKPGRTNDEVPVRLRDWKWSRESALSISDPVYVYGILPRYRQFGVQEFGNDEQIEK